MTGELHSTLVHIEHLAVRYHTPEETVNPVAVRLEVERMLQVAELQPPGLPQDAVLILRHLRCTVPLALFAASTPHLWSEYVHRQLSDLYHLAARPAYGTPALEATSVLFADAGEMLICLTRDLLAGRAWQQWYWQQLLRNIPLAAGSALANAWNTYAMYLPVALGQMDAAESSRAVALLSTSEVNAVVRAVHSAFMLPVIMLESSMRSSRQPSQDAASSPSPSHHAPVAQHAIPDRSAAPPWQRWLPASTIKELRPEAHYLLGLCVAIYHAPAFARSTTFARQSTSWFQQAVSQTSNMTASVQQTPAPSTGSRPDAPLTIADQDATFAIGLPLVGKSMSLEDTSIIRSAAVESKAPPEATQLVGSEENRAQSSAHYEQINREISRDVEVAAEKPFPAEGYVTHLGGILYLVRLLQWLELPGGDEQEEAITTCVGGWDIIAALALALLGPEHHRYAEDPIWHVLADLERRKMDVPIGGALPARDAFRLPARWLKRAGNLEPVWDAVIGGTRLLLFDTQHGYPVIDVPFIGHTISGVIQAEVETYRAQGIAATWSGNVYGLDEEEGVSAQKEAGKVYSFSLEEHSASLLGEHMRWWVEHVLAFVRYLLVRALATLDIDALAETLLCKSGQLFASRTHVDLYMHLDQVSVAVRRSGLDCNPGWVPDLGRIVLFHFG